MSISTHVLDVARGRPAGGMAVTLSRRQAGGPWSVVGRAVTDSDGRVKELVMTCDRSRRLVGARLPELRRSLDIGEEEGHRAGRERRLNRFGHVRVCHVHF